MREFHSVSDALEQYVAPFEGDDGDWAEILRRADANRPPRRLRFGVAAGAAIAVCVLAILLWPFAGDRPGVLDRALAAVGAGPVLHVVFEDDFHGTVVDLATGERRDVHGQREVWYDPARGVHWITRFGGAVQSDEFFGPREVPRQQLKSFALLGEDYRDALQSGRARNLGPGEAYGEPVYWIRVDAEMLPDAADGKRHEWAHDVAVSRRTFEPVATRETRDAKPGLDTGARILRLETLAAGAGDFSTSQQTSSGPFKEGIESITREEATDALGRIAQWLGPEHAGLPLVQVLKTTRAAGRHSRTELFGSAAADAIACRDYIRRNGRPSAACDRMRRAGRSLEMRGDRVYELGPVEWGPSHTGVRLFYGTLGDDQSTYAEDQTVRLDSPYVGLTETRYRGELRGSSGYVPPEGSVLLIGGRLAVLATDGVYVGIAASSEELVLSAARALGPMPQG